MKKQCARSVIFAFLLSSLFWYAGDIHSQTLVIDNFNTIPEHAGERHLHFVRTQEGYDIYSPTRTLRAPSANCGSSGQPPQSRNYTKAGLRLSRIPISTSNVKDLTLRLVFDLPPVFSWGNWLSVRRELPSPLDLSDYKGLKIDVKVESPAAAVFLRITLSDLTDDAEQGDEMWWFDCDRELLTEGTEKWINVVIPFDGFKASHGAGTRHNDHTLNLKKIAAYEINLISESGKTQKGVVLLDYLRAYK